jgi:NAD(P)-dependent dehydrogenase (short-subunit alcohol dehydrogenase family)
VSSAGLLEGRIALVTGAGAGLGSVLARAFAEQGAAVAAHGRSLESTAAVVDEIERAGGRAVAVAGDLGGGDVMLAGIVDQVRDQLGSVDLLINNAADQRLTPLREPSLAIWRQELEVNLLAVAELTRLVCAGAPTLAGVGVVNVASVEGLAPFPDHAAYAASKAALISLTASSAGEFAPARVNGIAAGLIDRPGLAEAWPVGHGWWSRVAPLGRPVTPEEVAAAAVFLASPAASGVTGVTLPVDAGWASSARAAW